MRTPRECPPIPRHGLRAWTQPPYPHRGAGFQKSRQAELQDRELRTRELQDREVRLILPFIVSWLPAEKRL